MDKLIKTLPAILAASAGSEEVAEAACLGAWKHAVGVTLSIHAVPLQLKKATLIVAVEDGLWQKQLEHMRGQLLFRLNSVLGQELVKSLELRIDPKALAKARGPAEQPKKQQDDYQAPMDLLSAAAEIEDPGLRRAFLGAATSCVRRLEAKSEEPEM